MEIGDKIKYYRNKFKISQAKLSQITGIHEVSISRYEANKVYPNDIQIEKISDAFGISPLALKGYNSDIRLETRGDLMGLFLMLLKNGVLQLIGDRAEKNCITKETASFQINPLIKDVFMCSNCDLNNHIKIVINDNDIMEKLLLWDGLKFTYNKLVNDNPITDFNELQTKIEEVELELQMSYVFLDTENGIRVLTPKILQ